ncbi:MAG: hypothetical protein ACP5US_00815 [Candidatus Kryptoniota bacterium]
MITHHDISLLSNYTAHEGIAISFYLNLNDISRAKRTWEAETKHLLKKARTELESLNVNKKFTEAAENDLKKIQRIIDSEVIAAKCKALAIFINSTNDFCQLYRLPVAVKSKIILDTDFYIRPLIAIMDGRYRIGVILLDSQTARLFEVYMGEIVEHVEFYQRIEKDKKTMLETFMKRDKHLMQRKDGKIRDHLARTADLLYAHYLRRHFDKIVISGHHPLIDHFSRFLPKRLQENIIGKIEINLKSRPNEILQQVNKLEQQYSCTKEETLIKKIKDELSRGGYAVKGLNNVIEALHSYNIRELAVADNYEMSGLQCVVCNMPYLEGKICPACGGELVEVPDIIDEIVQEALHQGAPVLQACKSESIYSIEKIAALTKVKAGELMKSIYEASEEHV